MQKYPTPVIETARLKLRPFTGEDAAAQFAIFADPAVVKYWSSETWTAMKQADDWIARVLQCYQDQSEVRFAIEVSETGAMIGNVNMHKFFDQNRRCELGYALASSHWGHGYAAEALEAALDYGFRVLDLNRVEADIDPANTASARLLEKLGFRKEGYMPERWFVHGQMADTVFYGLLRRYWDERSGA